HSHTFFATGGALLSARGRDWSTARPLEPEVHRFIILLGPEHHALTAGDRPGALEKHDGLHPVGLALPRGVRERNPRAQLELPPAGEAVEGAPPLDLNG